jgi:hypothetical protein
MFVPAACAAFFSLDRCIVIHHLFSCVIIPLWGI